MNDKVRCERDGAVLVVTIQNPPVNAGSLEVRRGVLAAIAELAADPALKAAVLIGGGTTFIAGSDLREFGQPLQEPQLPAVIAAIEQCDKPVLAALHGAALGGGFELALGCDGRIAQAKAVVGLPEVTLGMIPGAGGTQRLPRLVGVARALRMVLSGERVRAAEALALGIVDDVVDGDLREAAVRRALAMSTKRRLRDAAVPPEPAEAADAVAREALAGGEPRPYVLSAIERVRAAALEAFDDALREERRLFQHYRMARDAAALRHLFFAEREAAKSPLPTGSTARPLRTVGVLGGGAQGEALLQRLPKLGLSPVAPASDDDGSAPWSTLDLLIDLRQDATPRAPLQARLRPGCVLALAAGSEGIAATTAGLPRPADALGLHLDGGLAEILPAQASAADAVATVLALVQRLGLQPLFALDGRGGIAERALAGAAPAAEAAGLVAAGVLARESDVDVAQVHARGFPRWRGGPVFEAQAGA